MSFPTIPTGAQILSALQADTTATRTFPSLTGLTKSSGDLLIAIAFCYQTSTGTDAAFSGWTGGFTEFGDRATATTMAIGMAYKWSTGSETGTFAVTQAGTITGHAAMIVMAIPGAHASTIPEAGTKVDGTTGAADIASFNPAGWDVEDTLWIVVGGSGEIATTSTWFGMSNATQHASPWTTVTLPANYTNGYATGVTADAAGAVEGAIGFRQLAAASADPAAFAPDLTNARNSALLIAVRPMPVVTGAALGAFTFTGAGVGVPGVVGQAVAAVTFGSTASGVPGVTGAALGAFTFGSTAQGVPGVVATALGAYTFTGEATGESGAPPVEGQALGAFTFGSVASGVAGVIGQAVAALAFGSTGAGVVGVPGAALGAFTFGSTGAGVVGIPGQGAAAFVFGATANGVPGVVATALGAFTFTGSAAGEIAGAVTGQGLGAFVFGSTGQGTAGHTGVGLAAFTFGSTALGVGGTPGVGLAAFTFTGAADGTVTSGSGSAVTGQAVAGFVFTAVAVGRTRHRPPPLQLIGAGPATHLPSNGDTVTQRSEVS